MPDPDRAKPRHLGPDYAAQFADASLVSAYRHRPAYPAELIAFLLELAGEPRALLDVGCGRGDLTLPLALHFGRVDAVDPSAAMLEVARRREDTEATQVRWICARLTEAPLEPPYDLITAGESLHWTDWTRAFDLLASALAPNARLAIVRRQFGPTPWDDDLQDLLARYSTNQDFESYDLIELLKERGLFASESSHATAATLLRSPLDDYLESFHSANGFSRDRMPTEDARAFDRSLRRLVLEHRPDGWVEIRYSARVDYGKPLQP